MVFKDEKGARRAFLRMHLLAKRGINPHSKKGCGAQRWVKAQRQLYTCIGRNKFTLAEWAAIEKMLHEQLGHFYGQDRNGVWGWQIPESKAKTRLRKRWEAALEQARQLLPDWCNEPADQERKAREILAA